ncbi:MAG: P-II family nitrogen regulator, partial [Gemmataceae bacterium]
MKQLLIVVKPFRAEAVLQVIAELGAEACVVREAKGYGRQKGYLDRYRGGEYSTAYLPKVEITVWVKAEKYDQLAQRVAKVA